MNAIGKEKIFEELRNYHTHQFPVKIKNLAVDNLRTEFVVLEDKIVTMVLSLISGKTEFVDATKDLDMFQNKLERTMANDDGNEISKNLFVAKISKLSEIMIIAKDSDFKLKPVRIAKVVKAV